VLQGSVLVGEREVPDDAAELRRRATTRAPSAKSTPKKFSPAVMMRALSGPEPPPWPNG